MKITTTLFLGLLFVAQVHSQIFNAGFENNNGTPLSSFTTVNNDGLTVPVFAPIQDFNTEAWIQFYDGYDNKIAFSTSYYDPAGQSNDWLITPAINIPSSGQPTLYWKAKSYDLDYLEDYEVRISTTDNELQSFDEVLLTVTGEQPFEFNSRSLDLSAYAGETIYLAFVNVTNDGVYLALDDLYISASADCVLPDISGITSSDLTENSFTVSWNATPQITTYDTGLTTFTVPVSSTGTQTTLTKSYTDLEPGTRYQFFLKNADCGSGWATPYSIWTAALPPYSYGFEYTEENYGEYDSDGWSSNSWINGSGGNAQEGEGYVFNNTSTSFDKNDWIFSYPIKVQEGETIAINYYAQMGSPAADPAILKITAATAPNVDGNFEELASETILGGDYEEYSASFTASETGIYYFGFGNVTPVVNESASLRMDNIRFVSETLSVGETFATSISVYPNPVKEHLFINAPGSVQEVQVYTATGKLVTHAFNTDKINLSAFSQGIYFVKIITEQGTAVKRIIK